MVSFIGGIKEAKQMNYCERKERQIRSKQMQEIQTLNDRKQTEGSWRGQITGYWHEGGHVMSRALLLSPPGESLNSSSESIIHYTLIIWV